MHSTRSEMKGLDSEKSREIGTFFSTSLYLFKVQRAKIVKRRNIMEDKILFECGVNSFYKNGHSLAQLYITENEIIMTKNSIWNLHTSGSSIFGLLDGDGRLWFRNKISNLKSITRTKAGLNKKACLFAFTNDEIKIIFDFPNKTIEKLRPFLPEHVVIDY